MMIAPAAEPTLLPASQGADRSNPSSSAVAAAPSAGDFLQYVIIVAFGDTVCGDADSRNAARNILNPSGKPDRPREVGKANRAFAAAGSGDGDGQALDTVICETIRLATNAALERDAKHALAPPPPKPAGTEPQGDHPSASGAAALHALALVASALYLQRERVTTTPPLLFDAAFRGMIQSTAKVVRRLSTRSGLSPIDRLHDAADQLVAAVEAEDGSLIMSGARRFSGTAVTAAIGAMTRLVAVVLRHCAEAVTKEPPTAAAVEVRRCYWAKMLRAWCLARGGDVVASTPNSETRKRDRNELSTLSTLEAPPPVQRRALSHQAPANDSMETRTPPGSLARYSATPVAPPRAKSASRQVIAPGLDGSFASPSRGAADAAHRVSALPAVSSLQPSGEELSRRMLVPPAVPLGGVTSTRFYVDRTQHSFVKAGLRVFATPDLAQSQ